MLTKKTRTVRHSSAIPAGLLLILAFPLLTLITIQAQEKTPQGKKADKEQRANDDVVRLHSELVVVSATITDPKGQYLHGLAQSEFAILEDGVSQTITSFASEEAPFSAAILVDMSGSMEYKFGLVRGAAASFVDHIRDDDLVAVYGFNNKIRLLQEFSNARDITDYIWDAKAENATRLYDCIDEAIGALIKQPETRRAIVVISDGWDSSSSKASFESVMKKALGAGITVYSIDLIDDDSLSGNGSEVIYLRRGRREMQEFAAQTGGKYVHSPQGDKLEESFTNMVDELRNQYTLGYYSTNPKRDGRWRKISVNVARQTASTRSRRGYYAAKD
jgi:Ca-activated chloride channel homolog